MFNAPEQVFHLAHPYFRLCIFQRHGEAGMKKLNQFGGGELLGSGSRAGAMHAVMDNAGGGRAYLCFL